VGGRGGSPLTSKVGESIKPRRSEVEEKVGRATYTGPKQGKVGESELQ
jgi:hypothetical protein